MDVDMRAADRLRHKPKPPFFSHRRSRDPRSLHETPNTSALSCGRGIDSLKPTLWIWRTDLPCHVIQEHPTFHAPILASGVSGSSTAFHCTYSRPGRLRPAGAWRTGSGQTLANFTPPVFARLDGPGQLRHWTALSLLARERHVNDQHHVHTHFPPAVGTHGMRVSIVCFHQEHAPSQK